MDNTVAKSQYDDNSDDLLGYAIPIQEKIFTFYLTFKKKKFNFNRSVYFS
jgi:hypothetical protein